MKKQKYNITMDHGEPQEVEGYVFNGVWGIDKRESQYYVLTHIPTGYRVWSSKTLAQLKQLVQEPEFFDEVEPNNIATAINRFCNKNGWK